LAVNQARWLCMASLMVVTVFFSACSMPEAETETAPQTQAAAEGLRFMQAGDPAPDTIAARVGDTVITVADVRREAVTLGLIESPNALLPTDQAYRDTLSDLIDQRLLALEAVARGVHLQDEARQRLAAAEERILGNVLVEGAISSAVTEAAIVGVYEEQSRLAPRTEEIRARHILVDSREEADEVARLLAEGQDFAALAATVSRDLSTRFNGGDLGYFTRSGIVPAFAQMAFDTAEGTVSTPFETEYGWHVLEVVDRRLQPRESLEDVRPNIIRFLTLEGIDDLLETLRMRYPVTRVAAERPPALRTTAPEVERPEVNPEAASEADPAAQMGGESEG